MHHTGHNQSTLVPLKTHHGSPQSINLKDTSAIHLSIINTMQTLIVLLPRNATFINNPRNIGYLLIYILDIINSQHTPPGLHIGLASPWYCISLGTGAVVKWMTPLESSWREAFESGVNQACLRLHVEGVNSSMWNTFVPGLTFRIMAGEIWHKPSLCYFTICALCVGNILEIVPGPDLRPRYRLGRIVPSCSQRAIDKLLCFHLNSLLFLRRVSSGFAFGPHFRCKSLFITRRQ